MEKKAVTIEDLHALALGILKTAERINSTLVSMEHRLEDTSLAPSTRMRQFDQISHPMMPGISLTSRLFAMEPFIPPPQLHRPWPRHHSAVEYHSVSRPIKRRLGYMG